MTIDIDIFLFCIVVFIFFDPSLDYIFLSTFDFSLLFFEAQAP